MGQVLHGSATTTEAIRRAIQHSHVWTYMDPARLQRVWQRLVPRSQLLTYIRLADAARAIVVIAASHGGFSRASTSTAPRHWPKRCGPDTRFGKRRSDRFAIFYPI